MVDIINEPLVHMLRNSLDHGVETPEQRGKTNKPKVANISLNAYQEGGKVVIKIQDDGRGIDKDIILKKAIEKGLVDPEKKMSDSEIYGLIFLPGFSSAEKVTDISGRGVGMDVVKKSIEQLQGKVEVTSELGFGTTITIELPFTLAITDGMLIRVGEERFIIPTINIDICGVLYLLWILEIFSGKILSLDHANINLDTDKIIAGKSFINAIVAPRIINIPQNDGKT